MIQRGAMASMDQAPLFSNFSGLVSSPLPRLGAAAIEVVRQDGFGVLARDPGKG